MWGERHIEIDWMLNNLITPGTCMDVGSHDSLYIWDLVRKQWNVLRIDPRPFVTDIPFTTCICKDVTVLSPGEMEPFDNIVCISALEHVGLGAYGQQRQPDPIAYQKFAVEHMLRFLKPNGRLLITVPFGKYLEDGWYLVYNNDMVENITKDKNVVEKTFYTLLDKERDVYIECTAEECPQVHLDNWRGAIRATSLACIALTI